ncbi:hypothetical protein [Thermofilum pendens]|uniref:Tetratricopeptide repeat protein n=1 Tax=Thermofilum pendens (strain DSM 2475 / Hrk 5) TaxID=368408 RepID=A1S1A1_THEPD|nr:hypothetical protein [Thermofilum pendens]ABL79231.1 hypothetical protein Tpen_1836 [Thermofilum pendens Hrk 5]
MNIADYVDYMRGYVERAPASRRGDLARAMFSRVVAFLGQNPGFVLRSVRDPYLKAYLLSEVPAYLPMLWEESLREVERMLPALSATKKVFVYSRLSETAKELNKSYSEYLGAALALLDRGSWRARSRMVISLVNLGRVEEAIELSRYLPASRRALALAEASALNPMQEAVWREAVESVKKVRDWSRRVVALSRLLKAGAFQDGYGSLLVAEGVARMFSELRSEADVYLALLVARNLAEAGFLSYAERLWFASRQFLRKHPLVDLDVEELAVEVALYLEGLDAAVEAASSSTEYSWYLLPALFNYAVSSGFFSQSWAARIRNGSGARVLPAGRGAR